METHRGVRGSSGREAPVVVYMKVCSPAAGEVLCKPSRRKNGLVVGKGFSLGLIPTHACFEAVDFFCWFPAILFWLRKLTHLEMWYHLSDYSRNSSDHTPVQGLPAFSVLFSTLSFAVLYPCYIYWHTQNCTLKVASLFSLKKSLLLVFLLASVPSTESLAWGTCSLLMCQTKVHGFVLLKMKSWLFMQFPMSHSTPLNYFWQM